MDFRSRLLKTLKAVVSIIEIPDILIGGSEVPNLIQPAVACNLVVSEDIDIVVPVPRHGTVKERIPELTMFRQSADEPSVLEPIDASLLEVNFIGLDRREEYSDETYILEDEDLPMIIFSRLSLLQPGEPVIVDGLRLPVPQPAGLLAEKLLTDRSGVKGDRDLLVALALLLVCDPEDLREFEKTYQSLSQEDKYAIRSGLSTLSLLESIPDMPDPTPHRALIAGLLKRVENTEI